MVEADPNKDNGKEKKTKRPSARDIVGSIFDGKKEAEAHKDSALFRPAEQSEPVSSDAALAPKAAQEDAIQGSRQPPSSDAREKSPVWQRALGRWAPKRRKIDNDIAVGDWMDRADIPVGIDIGTRSIRAVQLIENKRNHGWKLINCAVRPFAHGDTAGDEKVIAQVERELKEVFSGDFRHLASVSSFSDTTAIAQVLRLPHMPHGEIRRAVAWELQEKYSMRSEDWHFDFVAIPKSSFGNPKEMSVLISAVPAAELRLHVAMLRRLRLSPRAIEVKPLPSWELFAHYVWPRDSAVLMVELGEQTSYVLVVAEGIPQFIHPLDFSGETLTKVIQGMLRLSFEEAEQFKIRAGIARGKTPAREDAPTDDDAQRERQAYLALRPFVDRLVSEVEQAFKYFSFRISQAEMRSYSKILLSGKTSQLKGLREHIESTLGVTTEFVQPLSDIAIDESVFDADELHGEALGLTTVIGLATRSDDQ